MKCEVPSTLILAVSCDTVSFCNELVMKSSVFCQWCVYWLVRQNVCFLGMLKKKSENFASTLLKVIVLQPWETLGFLLFLK